MKTGVPETIFTHKNIKVYMGQQYPQSTIWEAKYCGNSRAMFLLFCDHRGTESDSYNIFIRLSQPIFTSKKTLTDLWDNDAHTIKNG